MRKQHLENHLIICDTLCNSHHVLIELTAHKNQLRQNVAIRIRLIVFSHTKYDNCSKNVKIRSK